MSTFSQILVKSPYQIPQTVLMQNSYVHFCHAKLGVSPHLIDDYLSAWLSEDIGRGDLSALAIDDNKEMQIFIIAKSSFVLCGLSLIVEILRKACGNNVRLFSDYRDGDLINKGDILLGGEGLAIGLLLGERTALNIASHLSGIATKTKNIVDALQKYKIDNMKLPFILETRKTTSGLRLFEKYATRVGGAHNHRSGLDAGLMLKENHLRTIGDINLALNNAKNILPSLAGIEIEVSSLKEFRIALNQNPHVIMLDNFSESDILQAVKEKNEANLPCLIEISGNLDETNLSFIAQSGVDYASIGALIHKSTWVDMSMQLYNTEL